MNVNGRKEVVVADRYVRGVVELNDDDIPVVFRWVCRNPQCCPEKPDQRALHYFVIYQASQDEPTVGTLIKGYEPLRPLHEVADLLPPERVRRINHTGR